MTAAKAVHNSPFIIICIYRQPDRLTVSVGHLGDELYPHKAYLIFRTVLSQLVDCSLEIVGLRIPEIIIYVIDMILVHHFFKEIVNIELGTGINNGLHLVKQIFKLYTLGIGNVIKSYLAVNALNYADLQH